MRMEARGAIPSRPALWRVYSYQGKNYGVPWDMGMVGWWYNKALFDQGRDLHSTHHLDRVPR